MRNLRSRPFEPAPAMMVNVQPCWFSGSQADVMRKFNDFKQIIADHDLQLENQINDIKHRGSIRESGNKKFMFIILYINYTYLSKYHTVSRPS